MVKSFFDGVACKESDLGNLNFLRDSEGRAVMANLPDGTRLRWRQMVKNGDFSNSRNDWYDNNGSKIQSVTDGICKVLGTGTRDYCIMQNSTPFVKDETYAYQLRCKPSVQETVWLGHWSDRCGIIATKDEMKSYVGVKTFTKTSNKSFYSYFGGVDDVIEYDYIGLLNLTTLFTACPSLMPTTASAFRSMFWSQGTEASKELGYTPYTEEPIECVVIGGRIVKLT